MDRPPRRLLRSRWTIVALGAIVVLATLGIFPATRPSHIDQMRDLPELYPPLFARTDRFPRFLCTALSAQVGSMR